ncbi:MFS multidrug transporter-like protein [Bisporella sp. PMI_857]|nr:MFS multidrug transporter-like protein [Bisporella sp. PMI_857]
MSAASSLPSENPTVVDDTAGNSTPAGLTDDRFEKELERGQIILESASTEPETRAVQGWKWIFVCVGLYLAILLYGLDNTIAADIQGAIVETYGDVSQLAWVGTGFPLGSVAVILTLGRGYGMFNVKWLHIGSVTVFATGSAVCGAAPNMDALLIGRVIAGAGGAEMYLGMLNLIAINTTARERPVYMGGTGVVWGTGTILGPIVGGAFADSSATWRWAFYINLVLFGVLSPAFLAIPTFPPQSGIPTLKKLTQLDWVGAVLVAGFYTSFVLGLTFGGVSWAWNSGRTIGTLVTCVVILIIFIVQQYFAIFTTPEHRLFPVDFIASRTLVVLHVTTACASTSMFVTMYYVPVMFQFSRGDSGLEAALFYIGLGLRLAACRTLLLIFTIGGVFILIGGALMFTVKATTSISAIYGFTVLIAIGAGLTTQSGYSVASAKVQPDRVSATIAYINVAQIGGLVVALAVSGTVFQNIAFRDLSKVLYPLGFPSSEVRGAIAGSQSDLFSHLASNVRENTVEIIVQTIGKTYVLVIAAGALCLVSSMFLQRERLFMEVSAGVA